MDKQNPIQTIKVNTIPKASENDFQKLLAAREAIDCSLRDIAPPEKLPEELTSEYRKSNDDIKKIFSEKELNRKITIKPAKKDKTYTTYLVLQFGNNVVKHCIASFNKEASCTLIPMHGDVIFQLPKTLVIPETTNGTKNIILPSPFYVEFMDENNDITNHVFLGNQLESYNAELDEDHKSLSYSSKMYPRRVKASTDNKNYLVFQYLPDKHQLQFLSGKVVVEENCPETQNSEFDWNGMEFSEQLLN